MNDLEVKSVPFMGAELMAAKDEDGTIWAGVRWMCDGIGLTKGQMQNERARIHADAVLSQGERNLVLPSKGGNQSTLCLKLDFVPLWLAKINITPAMQADTPELAKRLEAYQLKAKDVLAAAFIEKKLDADMDTIIEFIKHFTELHEKETELINKMTSNILLMNQNIINLNNLIENHFKESSPAATSHSHTSKAMSPWRSNMYSIAKPLARRMNITVKQLMFNIYKQMRTEYSWDFLTEKKKYILNHGESKDISTVDVIEDSEMYSSIFMAILKDVYTANTLETPEWHEINAADVALAPIEASDVEISPVHDRRCKADNIPWCDKVSKAINDFAILRGDKTANHMATYRMVFNALDKSKVDAIRARYVKRYGLPKRSAQIFNSKQRAQMIFDAIEELKAAM